MPSQELSRQKQPHYLHLATEFHLEYRFHLILSTLLHTLGPAYNASNDAKETARYKWVLVVSELFNIAVNDVDVKKAARYSRVLAVIELVLSETQCRLLTTTDGMPFPIVFSYLSGGLPDSDNRYSSIGIFAG